MSDEQTVGGKPDLEGHEHGGHSAIWDCVEAERAAVVRHPQVVAAIAALSARGVSAEVGQVDVFGPWCLIIYPTDDRNDIISVGPDLDMPTDGSPIAGWVANHDHLDRDELAGVPYYAPTNPDAEPMADAIATYLITLRG